MEGCVCGNNHTSFSLEIMNYGMGGVKLMHRTSWLNSTRYGHIRPTGPPKTWSAEQQAPAQTDKCTVQRRGWLQSKLKTYPDPDSVLDSYKKMIFVVFSKWRTWVFTTSRNVRFKKKSLHIGSTLKLTWNLLFFMHSSNTFWPKLIIN